MADARSDIGALGLRPNKALGQNFLCDEGAIRGIVNSVLSFGLPVLEIGAGLGALTVPLAASGTAVTAVEIDERLAAILGEKLAPYPNARVVNADFIKLGLGSLGIGGPFAVAGNLPYYITSPICMRLVTAAEPISAMVLMMQREAAERFFARPGDKNYGPLTILSGLLFDAKEIMDLPPGAYYPPPEVSSTVLEFRRKDEELPPALPGLLKCSFAMRRKTLYNNLPAAGLTKQQAAQAIEAAGLPASVRAEALTGEDFIRLASVIEELRAK